MRGTGAIRFECRVEVAIDYVWQDLERLTRGIKWTMEWREPLSVLSVQRDPPDEGPWSAFSARTIHFKGVVFRDHVSDASPHRIMSAEELPGSMAKLSVTPRGPQRADLLVSGLNGADDELWPVIAQLAELYDDVRNAILLRPDLDDLTARYPGIRAIRDAVGRVLQLRRNGHAETPGDKPDKSESGRPKNPRRLTWEQRLRLEEFHESGMTQEDWCDEHRHELGYPSLRTLRNWLEKEAAEDSSR